METGWISHNVMDALENNNCTILYDDDDIIAVNKCTGINVIPARGEDSAKSLKIQLEKKLQCNLFIVHRIDRMTSGVVLFAKNTVTHSDLCRQFERREVKKSYLALIDGILCNDVSCCEPIREFGSGRMGVHPDGKMSHTDIEVIENGEDVTLVKARPVTGRRHQIRVHLYHRGHPILGDTLYGKKRPVRNALRLMLHAQKVQFRHPGCGVMIVDAPTDASWQQESERFLPNQRDEGYYQKK